MDKTRFKCVECKGNQTFSIRSLQEHIYAHHYPVTCYFKCRCGQKFYSFEWYSQHVRKFKDTAAHHLVTSEATGLAHTPEVYDAFSKGNQLYNRCLAKDETNGGGGHSTRKPSGTQAQASSQGARHNKMAGLIEDMRNAPTGPPLPRSRPATPTFAPGASPTQGLSMMRTPTWDDNEDLESFTPAIATTPLINANWPTQPIFSNGMPSAHQQQFGQLSLSNPGQNAQASTSYGAHNNSANAGFVPNFNSGNFSGNRAEPYSKDSRTNRSRWDRTNSSNNTPNGSFTDTQ